MSQKQKTGTPTPTPSTEETFDGKSLAAAKAKREKLSKFANSAFNANKSVDSTAYLNRNKQSGGQ